MSYTTHRRLFGLLLGALTGLAYTLVAQNINPLVMPGIPFYQPPFGPAGNTLLGGLLGGLLGFLTAWAETGFKGVMLGSLTGALVLVIATLLTGQTGQELWWSKIVGVTLIFFPVAAVLSPVLILLRWLINREEEAYRESLTWRPPARLPRIGLPVLLVLLAGLLGLTALYNDLARTVTPRMLALVEQGRAAQRTEGLPDSLRVEGVRSFLEHAGQPYTLQWDKDDSNRFAIPRPNTSPFDQSTVIARFADGYLLACVYPDTRLEPRCKDYAPGQPIP
jgi:hypothetical protein